MGRGLQTVLVRLIDALVQSILGDNEDTLVAGIVVVVFQQRCGSGTEGAVGKALKGAVVDLSVGVSLLLLGEDGLVVHLFEADSHTDGQLTLLVQIFVDVGVFEEVPDLSGIGIHHGDAHAGNVLKGLLHGLLAHGLIGERIGYDIVEDLGSLFADNAVGIAVFIQFYEAAFAEDIAVADACDFQRLMVRGDFVQAASLDDDGVIGGDQIQVVSSRHSVHIHILPLGLVIVGAFDPGTSGNLGALGLQFCPGFFSGGDAAQIYREQRLVIGVEVQMGVAHGGFHRLAFEIDDLCGLELFHRVLRKTGPDDVTLVDRYRFHGIVFFDKGVDLAVYKQFVDFLFHVSPLE